MVNDKQFFISKVSAVAFDSWKEIPLTGGYSLYYQNDLNIIFQNSSIILLGYAWQVDPNRQSPQEELLKLCQHKHITHEDVYEIEKSWCGRYILIVGEWIYMDACGTLGVFYSDQNVSSSLNVLCTLENRNVIFPDIVHRKSPDFLPGMRTTYDNVLRLLPSQLLNYITKKTKIRPLLIDKAPKCDTEEELIKVFNRYIINSAQNLSKTFPRHHLWIAMTGGRDSRLTLACCEKSGIKYDIFTLWHEHITSADHVIPHKLAKAIGRKLHFIKRNKNLFSQKRYDDYKTHTAGMAVDEDWNFYAYYQYQSLIEDNQPIVIIRSCVYEIPENIYKSDFGEGANDITVVYKGILKNDLFYKSCMEWKSYAESIENETLNNSISFLDKMYWDLRCGSWLSSVEQSFDMMEGITSLQMANSRLLISIMYGFDADQRFQRLHEEKITNTLCPAFAKIPYDYQYESFNQWLSKVKIRVKRFVKHCVEKVLRRTI